MLLPTSPLRKNQHSTLNMSRNPQPQCRHVCWELPVQQPSRTKCIKNSHAFARHSHGCPSLPSLACDEATSYDESYLIKHSLINISRRSRYSLALDPQTSRSEMKTIDITDKEHNHVTLPVVCGNPRAAAHETLANKPVTRYRKAHSLRTWREHVAHYGGALRKT